MVKAFYDALTIAAVAGAASAGTIYGDSGEYTLSAEIRYIETDARQEDDALIFGDLAIELPEGVRAEVEEAAGAEAKEGQTIRLAGAEELVGDPEGYDTTGPFPPQISMSHYSAGYECEEALIYDLLDLLPGENLRMLYEDDRNDEYIFRLEGGAYEDQYDMYSYVIVRDEDVYLISEFFREKKYSFSALWEQGKVRWQDSSRMVKYDDRVDASYFRITPEQGMSFLGYKTENQQELYFYQEGYYDSCYASYDTGRLGSSIYSKDLTDVNFDGFMDIALGDSVLVWDSEKAEFIQVEYPEDMPSEWERESFPETKTIWGCTRNYVRSDHVDYVESLWQWDGFAPVKKRECRAEVREDEVRFWAYEDTADNIMFDESFTPEEWDDGGNENIGVLYGQFYDGLIPQDVLSAGEGEEKIPQGLLDKVTDAMMGGTEAAMLKEMMVSTELGDEECYEAAEKNRDIRVNVLSNESCVLARADVDNDGIEDIIGEFYWGGSGGFVSYILFQGQADGTYIETDSFDSVKEEFGIVNYDGKNYLIRTIYDYAKKFYNGFTVAVFEKGIYTEEVRLTLYAEDYDLAIAGSEEGYEAFAEKVVEQAVSYDEMVKEYEVIVGSAEERTGDSGEYPYMCDLDNDGEIEYYDKHIWTTSNMYTRDTLEFSCEDGDDEGVALIQEAIQRRWLDENYYNDIMLWADEADGKTVVNVMYQTSLEDFVIVGYVVGGSEYKETEACLIEAYEITADAVLKVRQTRYPRSDRGESAHMHIV